MAMAKAEGLHTSLRTVNLLMDCPQAEAQLAGRSNWQVEYESQGL